MTAGAPWSVKGIDPKAREIAKDLARRSGMTLGEWLNQMIMDDGPEAAFAPEPAPPAQVQPARRRFDSFTDRGFDRGFQSETAAPLRSAERPAAPIQRLQAAPMEEDDIARIAEGLDRLSARIEAAEHRSTLAISGVDQSVAGVLARMETAEREQIQVAARFEGAVEDIRTDQLTIAQRLHELEQARTGARSAEALKSLESALTRVAGHLYEGEGRTRDALIDMRRDFDGLADRVQRVEGSNDPRGASVVVEQVVARIAERLEAAEGKTAEALRGLEGSFASLDQRLRATEAKVDGAAPAERRFEQLASDLTQRVEQVRVELADRLKDTADGRFDRMEGALREMTGHVQAAEQRSAQAIERMGQEVVRMADSLNQKVQSVEQRNAGDLSRIADAVEGRMKRAEVAQSEALEKLGSDIARITERLAERIASTERRSAQSMDDVGEQVSRATERLQQRQERASAELVDRMRQSEERTARLLEEAREKIDQRLSEAQKRLAESPPPPVAANPAAAIYVDPYAADPFGGAEAFSPQDLGGFGGQIFPSAAAAFGGQSSAAVASASPAADAFASAFADPGPFAPEPPAAAAPAFAPADIEAADAFVPFEPPYAASAFDDALPAELEPDFDAAYAAAPEAEPTTRSESTRELIAQARAAARAASQPPEPRAGRKTMGGKADSSQGSGPIFSGFGLGRRKAKAEGSSLKTALLMSTVAAFLGLGTAGLVLQNGGAVAGWSNGARKPQVAGRSPASAPAEGADVAAADAPPAQPLDPNLALAIAPPSTAPAPPSAEAQALYAAAVAQIDGGDNSGVEPLRRASNLGYAPAQYYLAKLYEDGKAGLSKNLPEARRWTERAAANGEPRAMHNLGTYYYDGQGGPQNSAAAVDWFKKAAELGWVDSQFNLAVMNEKGLGVRRNPAEAYKWYLIAARGGDEPSRAKAAELKKLLSPDELATSERAASGYRAETPNASARLAGTAPAIPGGSVASAQRALSRLGYYQGPIDGVASPALRLAVSAYQRDKGLSASGELTPELAQRFASATR